MNLVPPQAAGLVTLHAHGRQVTITLPNPDDHIQRIINQSGSWYERDLLEDWYCRVKGGVAIDVGAHIGTHTLWLTGIMRLEVIALEANPAAFEVLKTNIANNDLSDLVIPLNVAAGRTLGRVSIVDEVAGNSGMARCVPDPRGFVRQVRIDDIDDKGDVSLIKVDIEGGEIDALRGAEATISKHRPLIYAEAATDEASARLSAYLTGLGYTRFGKFARTPVYGYAPN